MDVWPHQIPKGRERAAKVAAASNQQSKTYSRQGMGCW
jgi:hypothetical protein